MFGGSSVNYPVPFSGLRITTVYAPSLGMDHPEPGRLEGQGLDPGQGLLLKSLSHISLNGMFHYASIIL